MKTTDSGVDYVSAPANYAELHERYYHYVVNLVRRNGVDNNHKEDVASDILLRFYERDFLTKFDPTLVFHYNGQDRPAKFRSFLTKFVLTYLRGHLDKQNRIATKELLLCDRPLSQGKTFYGDTSQATWIEVFGDPEPGADIEVLNKFGEGDLVVYLRDYISRVPRRSKFDTCDLLALFDEVVRQYRRDGFCDIAELRAKFGISSTAIHSWMWWLRANIAQALNRPLPAKRPRTVRPRS